MQLFINKNLIDFEIDKKETLSNILESIEKWASKGEKYILDYKVTSKNPGCSINYNLSYEDIQKIEIQLGNKTALVTNSTEEFYRHLEKTCNFLLDKYTKKEFYLDYQNLQKNLKCIYQTFLSLSYFFQQSKNDVSQQNEILNQLSTLLERKEDYFQKSENIFYLISYLNTMKYHINIWHQICVYNAISKEEAEEFIKQFFSYFDEVEIKIEKIAIDFSSGKENIAIIELYTILEILTNYVLLLNILKKSTVTQEKVLLVFNELLNSISNSNFLNTADIIDYDLREIVAELKKILI